MQLAAYLALSVAAAAAGVVAEGPKDPYQQWRGPKAGDVRGPCPFLNTFANHGFLPRSGKHITQKELVDGLFNAVHFDKSASEFLFEFAITTNPQPNATWFSLDHLTRHNILEHDASLSRLDTALGRADIFDQKTFDETRSHWGKTVNAQNGAAAIIGRINTCKATNPQFSLSDLGESFTIGETSTFISILGDRESLTVDRRLVEFLFQNERLPTHLGWKRPAAPFTLDNLLGNLDKVQAEYHKQLNASTPKKRGDKRVARKVHGGATLVY